MMYLCRSEIEVEVCQFCLVRCFLVLSLADSGTWGTRLTAVPGLPRLQWYLLYTSLMVVPALPVCYWYILRHFGNGTSSTNLLPVSCIRYGSGIHYTSVILVPAVSG